MKIPIENIYYLLCYAWDKLDEAEVVDAHAEDEKELIDLFAKVLTNGTRHLLRRGIDRGYLVHDEAIPGIRGKFMPAETVKRSLLITARAWCSFDELSADVLHNQILKATLHRLARHPALDAQLREDVTDILARFPAITNVSLTTAHFRRVQLHRNNAFYDFLLQVCRFLFDTLMIEEQTGQARFRDFLRDEGKMRILFQNFVLNFFRREQTDFEVSTPQIDWYDVDRTDPAIATLPKMHTDIVLTSKNHIVVIDTKFTPLAFHSHYEKERAQSGHLYQIFSYVKNLAAWNPTYRVDGMLLYPVIDEPFAEHYPLAGHTISIRSIDLGQPWRRIEADLLALRPAPLRPANVTEG